MLGESVCKVGTPFFQFLHMERGADNTGMLMTFIPAHEMDVTDVICAGPGDTIKRPYGCFLSPPVTNQLLK